MGLVVDAEPGEERELLVVVLCALEAVGEARRDSAQAGDPPVGRAQLVERPRRERECLAAVVRRGDARVVGEGRAPVDHREAVLGVVPVDVVSGAAAGLEVVPDALCRWFRQRTTGRLARRSCGRSAPRELLGVGRVFGAGQTS